MEIDEIKNNIVAEDSVKRKQAAIDLKNIDRDIAIPLLIILANDPVDFVREQSIRSLGNYNQDSVIRVIINALTDDSEMVRNAAIWILGNLKDERAVAPLIHQFRLEPRIDELKNIASSLGLLGEVEFLVAQLNHSNVEIKIAVLYGISMTATVKKLILTPEEINNITTLLDAENPDVRYLTIMTLRTLHELRSVSKIRELAQKDHAITSWEDHVSEAAQMFLDEIE